MRPFHLLFPRLLAAACLCAAGAASATTTTINFDDVGPDGAKLTNRYASQGVTLRSINNWFPVVGPYASPNTLPVAVGDVVAWALESAPSQPYMAVGEGRPGGDYGNAGILISFAQDVSYVSLVGNDLGRNGMFWDNEAVTLTAYDADGRKLGYTHATEALPGPYDQVFASISASNIRHVAFNYSETRYGFYGIDDLTFITSVPEASTALLMPFGLAVVVSVARLRNRRSTDARAASVR